MPYERNSELPGPLRRHLPIGAQTLYRAAFNAAFGRYGPAHEAIAHRIAWAAVKRGYIRRGIGVWTLRRDQAAGSARRVRRASTMDSATTHTR